MTDEIKRTFHIEDVDPFELGQVLLAYFGRSSGTEKGHRYKKDGDNDFVEVEFNKKGDKISDIILSSDFPNEKLEEIQQKITEKLVEGQTTKIAQGICFTPGIIDGKFKYKDHFQILPVPESAPKPPDLVSPHPFLLQHAYVSSSDIMISAFRKSEEFSKWGRLLTVFLNLPVSLQDYGTLRTWVMVPSNSHRSECLQNGYNYAGYSGEVSNFSSFTKKIGTFSFEEDYFEGIGAGSVLEAPENLNSLLDKALALDANQWDKFYRACTWYSQAWDIWGVSRSSSFIALVSALESLIEEPEMCGGGHPLSTGEVCEHCGEPKFDITLHFKDFIDTYVPELKEYPEERNIIYRVRSNLAHGTAMLLADKSRWGAGVMNKASDDEDSRHRNLFRIVKIAIIRWLDSQR